MAILISRSTLTAEDMAARFSEVYRKNPGLSPVEPSVSVVMFSGNGTQGLYEVEADTGLTAETFQAQKEAMDSLAFEPEEDAVSRMIASMPTGDNRVVRELCEGDTVCTQLSLLSGIIRSDWYANKKDFFVIDSVEMAEDTGYSYVYVKIRLPASGNQRETMLDLVFEMERIKLRWHIYNVKGLDEFLRRANRARGIL